MKRRLFVIQAVHLVLMGSLCLTGCPGAGGVGQGTPIAGITESNIVTPQVGGETCTAPDNVEALVKEVLARVNQERTKRGCNELSVNPLLTQIAEDLSCEMIEEGFFTHEHPVTGEGPGQRAINAGYIFLAIGENLAVGQATPVQVMREWMASTQGHRENILSAQWTEIGLAVRTGGEYGVYWVQEFGNPP